MRITVLLVSLLLTLAAAAQGFPGRERRGGPRDGPPKSEEQRPRPSSMPAEPFSALEREMPSLQVDLQLKAEQVAAWRLFERDVRDLAEIGRQRTRYLLALRDPGDKPLPSAADVLTRLADEDRRRSDATADLKRHFDVLYALLDDAQRRMLDRRVVLSQTEPLGTEAPAKR